MEKTEWEQRGQEEPFINRPAGQGFLLSSRPPERPVPPSALGATLPEDHCQDLAPPPANGRPGPAQGAPPANRTGACWGAAGRGEGFGPSEAEGERVGWAGGRGTRPYLVFGFPPCGAGSSQASWRRTRSSRFCERSHQNEEMEGDGCKEEDTQTEEQNPREYVRERRSKPQPLAYWY